MARQKFNNSKHNLLHDLKVIKLSVAAFVSLLLLSLPFITTNVLNANKNLDNRSSADSLGNSISSWVVSPNGGEVMYGNSAIQFYAKSTQTADAKFSFSADLYKDEVFFKNLFSIGVDSNPTNRDGIYTKYADLTGIPENDGYKIKLTTSDPAGENVVADFSDKTFTISPNSSKPEFTSTPPNTNIYTGDLFDYTPTVKNPSDKIVATVLPSWLTFTNNKLSGKTNSTGVYSVSLVAINSAGRQTSQIFSINVGKKAATTTVTKTPVPTSKPITTTQPGTNITPSSAPVVTTQPVGTIPAHDPVVIQLPAGDNLSTADSRIRTVVPESIKNDIVKITVEVSPNAKDWTPAYDGKSFEFSLDITKYTGGDYYLRITLEYKNGIKEVINSRVFHIIRPDTKIESVGMDKVKPVPGDRIYELRPVISAIFENKINKRIDLKTFKFILNGKDMTADSEVRLTETSFSYVPPKDLTPGKYDVRLEIGPTVAEISVKEWSFQILDKTAAATTQSNSLLDRKLLLGAVAIVVLIFLIAVWAIRVMKKERQHIYLPETEQNSIFQA
jgi:hypothetical protein